MTDRATAVSDIPRDDLQDDDDVDPLTEVSAAFPNTHARIPAGPSQLPRTTAVNDQEQSTWSKKERDAFRARMARLKETL